MLDLFHIGTARTVLRHDTRYLGRRGLGSLGGLHAGASDINSNRRVVGGSNRPFDPDGNGGGAGAFLWTPEHGMQELPTLAGGFNAAAAGVNEFGEIAGSASNARGITKAVLWRPQPGPLVASAPVESASGAGYPATRPR
jgi:uncharacterized membrane protein